MAHAPTRPAPRIPFGLSTLVVTLALYAALGLALSGERPERVSPAVARLLAWLPLVIAVVNTAALLALLAGWRAIVARRIQRHRRLMLTAAALISVFLVLYLTRVFLGGTKAFPGPAPIRAYVYLPALAIHIVLSIVSVPLVVHNLLTGLLVRVPEVRKTRHVRVGRAAVLLWSVSLTLGILVYFLLNVFY